MIDIYKISTEERVREEIRMREKALHDQASMLASAEKRGRAEGRDEREAEIAAKMRANGMTDEQINCILYM